MSPSGPVLQQQQRETTGPCMEYVLHVVDSRRTELDPLFFLHYFLEEEKERERVEVDGFAAGGFGDGSADDRAEAWVCQLSVLRRDGGTIVGSERRSEGWKAYLDQEHTATAQAGQPPG